MPKVSVKYGAPIGRNRWPNKSDQPCRLFRVNLDSGGYDDGGAYWGIGGPLYCCTDDEDFRVFTRASSREDAYEKLVKEYGPIKLKRGIK